MRVYVPGTTVTLQRLVHSGILGPPPLTAFAVTPELREWYVDDDVEALEYTALAAAAQASLRLIDADPTAARRRVVLAADVPDAGVTVRDDLDRGAVQVAGAIPLAAIASVHVDDAEAEATVALAARSIVAAELGDAGAQELVDDADGYELSWYANQEIGALLALL